jgi:hypothetical protein
MSKSTSVDRERDPETLKFPAEEETPAAEAKPVAMVADDALAAIESMSRRIDDLARELNCLGSFNNDDDDRPRAA